MGLKNHPKLYFKICSKTKILCKTGKHICMANSESIPERKGYCELPNKDASCYSPILPTLLGSEILFLSLKLPDFIYIPPSKYIVESPSHNFVPPWLYFHVLYHFQSRIFFSQFISSDSCRSWYHLHPNSSTLATHLCVNIRHLPSPSLLPLSFTMTTRRFPFLPSRLLYDSLPHIHLQVNPHHR